MVVGTIDTFEQGQVTYPEAIRKALEFLRNQDFTNMQDGRYVVEGECYASLQRYETRPLAACRPEAHRKYVDIQYMVEGEEYVGWCPFSPDLSVAEDYNEAQDVAFYDALVPDSNILLQPVWFAVLYPEDVHRPQGAVDGVPMLVTKVVVKVPISML